MKNYGIPLTRGNYTTSGRQRLKNCLKFACLDQDRRFSSLGFYFVSHSESLDCNHSSWGCCHPACKSIHWSGDYNYLISQTFLKCDIILSEKPKIFEMWHHNYAKNQISLKCDIIITDKPNVLEMWHHNYVKNQMSLKGDIIMSWKAKGFWNVT